jgi:hypothetical protein
MTMVSGVISCGVSEADRSSPAAVNNGSIWSSNPMREAAEIRNELIIRALHSQASGEELVDIIHRNDQDGFRCLLGYSESEFALLIERLQRLSMALRAQQAFSDRATPDNAAPCLSCDLADFAKQWNVYRERAQRRVPLDGDPVQVPVPDPSDKGVTCQWALYVGALGLCTVSGNPIVYFLCAVIALCRFCTGGWVTTFCD